MPAKDLKNIRFGRLLVIERTDNAKNKKSRWICRCDCGNITRCVSSDLSTGHIKSCGCLLAEANKRRLLTHGKTLSRAYRTWQHMKNRCTNKNDNRFKYYGERGIKVCERWQTFENFYADMGDQPEGMSIDRIDNNGDYSPENCRWATTIQQANNKTSNRLFLFNGKYQTSSVWAREYNIKLGRLKSRLRRGWPIEKAILTP